MKKRIEHTPLEDSEHPLPAGARVLGESDRNRITEVTVLLRYADRPTSAEHLAHRLPGERKHLKHHEFEKAHGASPADVERVVAFAADHDLEVVETDAAHRMVVLSGTLKDLGRAFNVRHVDVEHKHGRYHTFDGPAHVPKDLAESVVALIGLHNRPVRRLLAASDELDVDSLRYTPLELAKMYRFPGGTDGTGETIALIELAGGYRKTDLAKYFRALGVTMPRIKDILISDAQNDVSSDPMNNDDAEVQMDIEVAGAAAPGAVLKVYFASGHNYLRAVKRALRDGVSVISLSWGNAEFYMGRSDIKVFEETLRDAAALGVTVCVATGDHGSSDGVEDDDDPDNHAHVEWPSSCPHALACGGTVAVAKRGKIAREIVWNDPDHGFATGGGVSDIFGVPGYQQRARITPRSSNPGRRKGRGIPDVSANAVGYVVSVNGTERVLGGTSAVAPLWAALIARVNERLGTRVGFLNPLLYAQHIAGGSLRSIDSGSNGTYKARVGWDACTGLGSPDGKKLLDLLRLRGP